MDTAGIDCPLFGRILLTEGDQLGSKKSLVQVIHEVTGIAIEALRGAPVAGFKIEDRFSWASRRATKRREDKAYSLLGLFDIYMPLLYGKVRKGHSYGCEKRSASL